MATPDQRAALLAITCPWCSAPPGETCSMPAPGSRASRDQEGGVRRAQRIPISTLDGGCHDARWQAAGLGSAPVRLDALADLHTVAPRRVQEPAVAAAGGSAGDRPW